MKISKCDECERYNYIPYGRRMCISCYFGLVRIEDKQQTSGEINGD